MAIDFGIMQTAMSYWLGALSEPVLIIDRQAMAKAAADGAIVWDVRPAAEFERGHVDGALSLGEVDWLLADNSGGNLVPAAVIEDVLGKAGIHHGRSVIIYAEGRAVEAFVALRALRSIGLGNAQVCLGDVNGAGAAAAASSRDLPGPSNASVAATTPSAIAPAGQRLGQPA
jgi:3-mercaptopyruvate sulfurtransferase SseA